MKQIISARIESNRNIKIRPIESLISSRTWTI